MSKIILDWGAIIEKSGARNIAELSRLTGISDDLLYTAQSGKRPISPTTRQALLRALVPKFKAQSDMELWLKAIEWDKSIPPYSYKEDISFLSDVFAGLMEIPPTLTFPEFYVPRPELEKQVINALLDRKSAPYTLPNRGLVISGMGGIGKSTLIGASIQRAVTDFHLWDTFPSGIYHIDFEGMGLDQIFGNLAIDLDIIPTLQDSTTNLHPLIKKKLRDKSAVFVLDGIQSIYDVEKFLDVINSKTSFVIVATRLKVNQADQSRLFLEQLEIPEQFSWEEAKSVTLSITRTPLKNSDHGVFNKIYERVAGLPLAIVILAGLSSATRLTWKTIEKSMLESSMKSLEFGEKASKHDSVRVAFDISYHYLKRKAPNATGAFMKIGLFARPKGQLSALQHVSNLNESLFQSALDTLVHANLIRIGSDSNYSEGWSTHTLLRDYAEEIRLRKDFRRTAAEKRYVDYYGKIALGFEDKFNQGSMHPLEFADAVPEICHAIEIAVNRNWSKEVVWLIRSSISPMIEFGQFSSLEFLEKIMEKETKLSSRERVVLLGGLAKIKLWRNDHHGAIQLLDSVFSFGFPTESVNAARTLAQIYLDEGDMDAAEKHLALAYSILRELPPEYPYPKSELWGQYYEVMGNYYLYTSQARLAYDAFTHAREFAIEHVGWTNHITNLIARCLLTLGDFNQTLTLLSSFPEDNNAEFSLHSVERNLIRAECYWRIGNSEQAKKNLMSTETMLHGVLDQPGLESHLATLNKLLNLIEQDKFD